MRTLSLDVRAEGVKQALRITNYNSERSAYRPRERSYSGTSTRQDTASTFGSVEAFEAISQDVPTTLTFSLRLAGIGISLINRKIVEVLYTTAKDTKLDYSDSPISRSVNFSCGTLQVDNQLHEAIYPVLVQPTPISKEASRVAALPTIQASMSWLKDQGTFFVLLICAAKLFSTTQRMVYFSSNTVQFFSKHLPLRRMKIFSLLYTILHRLRAFHGRLQKRQSELPEIVSSPRLLI